MKREETPFIHCIETPLGQYVFDVNTNQFLTVKDSGLYHALKAMEERGEEPAKQYSVQIKEMKDEGYLSNHRPSVMRHPMSDHLAYQLAHNVEQMTLQVTQACNLRCTYCTYLPQEFHYQREHSAKRMSWETAKKAVDFFLEHSRDQMEPVIGFYGGEPLLEFHLIQKVIEYAEKQFGGKGLRFSMTTNGTLLTPDVTDYLMEHQMMLTLSLDGSEAEHNRSRKFASNGHGSYQIIMENLQYLSNQYPSALTGINVVMDQRFDFRSVIQSFSEDPILSRYNVKYGQIDDYGTMEQSVPSNDFRFTDGFEQTKVLLQKLKRLESDDVTKYGVSTTGNMSTLETELAPMKMADITSHSGPCIPGQKRLLVDVDGQFYPCERVSETTPAMRIGNLQDGYSYEQANRLLNVCQLTEEQCGNCWALRHCISCCHFCDNCGSLSSEYKLSHCAANKRYAEYKFRWYLMHKELKVDL